jgi:hypothetical protein
MKKFIMVIVALLFSMTTQAATAATFTQDDLTGTWRINNLRTSGNINNIKWMRALVTLNSSGVATCVSLSDGGGGTTCPSPFDLTFTMNETTGVITQSGANAAGDGGHMTMTLNKNFAAGTETNGENPNYGYEMTIIQKVVSGTTYSASEVQNKSLVYHQLRAGHEDTWIRGAGNIDSAGLLSLSEIDALGKNDPLASTGMTLSLDADGIVTLSGEPSFQGFLSDDKKTVVATHGTADKGHHLMVIQITGRTYTAGTFPAGTSVAHTLGCGAAAFWIHYTNTIDGNGVMTFSDWVASNPAITAPAMTYTGYIDASGTVTIDGNPTYHGQVSHDRTFTVGTQTGGIGNVYMLNVSTKVTSFPIAATAGQELSRSAAFDGTNYLVGIQGDANAHNNITAQLISPSGALVGSRISVGRTGGAPNIAFDGTNYLMVWPDDATQPMVLYGQRVSKLGQLVGSPFIIGTAWNDAGAVIFDGANYFVAWEMRPGEIDTADVYGQFISPSGTLLGAAIPVSTAAHAQTMPQLAFDGTNILAVWADGRNQSACYPDGEGTHCHESDIYGQFVTKSSSGAAGSLSGSNFWINLSSLPRHLTGPVVAYDGTNYFIVFNEATTLPNACPPSGCTWHIFGQLVSPAGTAIGGTISIRTQGNQSFQSIIFDGTQYLVTWNDMTNDTNGNGACDPGEGTCLDFYGQVVSKSGTLIDSALIINNDAGNQLGVCGGPAVNGRILCIINTGFVGPPVFSGGDVYGVFLDTLDTQAPLYADFAGAGIWKWDGSTWSQVTPNAPTAMAASGSILYGNFSPGGIWKWDGSSWSQVTPNSPTAMAAAGSLLYGNFGTGAGIWKWDGSSWSQVTPNSPTAMAAAGSLLYGNFGTGAGIWKWDGSSWSQVTPNSPTAMAASGSLLYGNFGTGAGIWKWDGSSWSQVTPNSPTAMEASGSLLYGNFGSGAGIWKWESSAWSQVTPNSPTAMAGSGSILYGNFGTGAGIWKWDGSSWSQVTPNAPTSMVVGF